MECFDELVTDPTVGLADIEAHLATLSGGDELFNGRYRVASTSGSTGRRGLFLWDPASGPPSWPPTTAPLTGRGWGPAKSRTRSTIGCSKRSRGVAAMTGIDPEAMAKTDTQHPSLRHGALPAQGRALLGLCRGRRASPTRAAGRHRSSAGLEERRRPRRLQPRQDRPRRHRGGDRADGLRLRAGRCSRGAARGRDQLRAAYAAPRARRGRAAHLDGDQARPDAVRDSRHPGGSRRPHGPRHVRPRHGGGDGARHAQQVLRRAAAHHPDGALLAAGHEPAGRAVADVRLGRERDHAPALHARSSSTPAGSSSPAPTTRCGAARST